MACDVEQYIPPSDSILYDSVERVVHSEGMVAYPASRRRRERFQLGNNLRLNVWGFGVPDMVLKGYRRKGDIYIELSAGDQMLRELHTHEGHRNPGGQLVPGTHMHFPTERFLLRRDESSYAYAVDMEILTVADGILEFCDMLNISTHEIQDILGG